MAGKDLHLETLCIHGGQSPEAVTGAVMPPVFQTSTYAQEGVGKHKGYEYARTQNPTREKLEAAVASLEGAKYALCYASGSAATDCIQHLLDAGDRVVCGDDVYGGTFRQFTKVFARVGIHYDFVDFTRTSPQQAIPAGTKLVWLESPTNPLLKVSDIAALSARAREVGAITVVDNTFATPWFQNPLALGADIVVHSTTKYINGHSDVVGGVIATSRDDLHERLRFLQNAVGAVPGPWDCWLTLRGLKTLAVRMERHQQNAKVIVDYLKSSPHVARVWYPFDESHPQHDLAMTQMRGFGGMISFELKGSLEQANAFVAATRLFTLAESLGGVESLIEVPASMTHASIPPHIRKQIGIADGLIRISVGIENAQDLVADLEQAMEQALRA